MDIESLISNMTVDEKAALVSGTDFMYTNPIPRLGIGSVCMSDGPHGLRKQSGKGDNGSSRSEPSTAFPTAAATASSWNIDNAYKMGRAIAEECRHYDVDVLLGPGVNIKRNPRCGRNFEYFSEDPYLSGEMGAAQVSGVQSVGAGATVKHFALNNAENYRFMGDSVCDDRAMREIYLKSFEKTVKSAKPYAVMCAYNKVNGVYCSENGALLNDVLRGEWGFDGVVMTDWGAMHDRAASLEAGLDLEMPGDTAICRKWILDGLKSGRLSVAALDTAVRNILNLKQKFDGGKAERADFDAHNALAAEIAADSAVLMKNDGALPLGKGERLLAVGDLFDKMRYQGAGSSMINPTSVTSPKTAFDKNGVDYEFARGYAESKLEPQSDMIAQAVEKADMFDKVVVFAGLTDYAESEGCDRENLSLPQNQLALINALIDTGKKIVVVLYGGSVVELPFADKVDSILNMFLPGQNGGTATYDLLFGDKTPSGKLAETWVESCSDIPFGDEYSKTVNEIYKESIYVGYRYYLTAKKRVRYPFGYGLSYTSFGYSDLSMRRGNGKIAATFTITNTGDRAGAEIAQLYIKAPKSGVFKPEKELRAFAKVYLNGGESKSVTLEIDEGDLSYYNAKLRRWVLESGEYELQICSDCETVELAEKFAVEGESVASPYTDRVTEAYSGDLSKVTNEIFEEMSGLKIPALPPKKPVTLESRFTDLKRSFIGRILFGAVLGVADKQMKMAEKMPDGAEKDNAVKGATFMRRILESNSIRSMSMCAGRSMPYNFAQGFVHLANGRLIKGIKSFCSKIKVPMLPKDKEGKK